MEPDHPALVIWCDLGPVSTPRDLAAIQSAITDLTENVLLIELLDRELISPGQLIRRRTSRFYLKRSPTFRSPLPVPRVLAAGYVNPWWQVIDVDLADVAWLGASQPSWNCAGHVESVQGHARCALRDPERAATAPQLPAGVE